MNTTDRLVGRPAGVPKERVVIGLTGLARSGKDTVAAIILPLLMNVDSSFRHASFAQPLKDMIEAGFGLKDKQDAEAIEYYGCTHRHMLQTLGTEWGRDLIGKDVWLNSLAKRTAKHSIVITDVRFDEEAAYVRDRGYLVHIVRTGEGMDSISNPGHPSERGVIPGSKDYILYNDHSLEALHDSAYGLGERLAYRIQQAHLLAGATP